MASDWSNLRRRLKAQGFHIEQGGKHLRVSRNGSLYVTLPVTPSDRRAIKNAEAQLRKIGYER